MLSYVCKYVCNLTLRMVFSSNPQVDFSSVPGNILVSVFQLSVLITSMS